MLLSYRPAQSEIRVNTTLTHFRNNSNPTLRKSAGIQIELDNQIVTLTSKDSIHQILSVSCLIFWKSFITKFLVRKWVPSLQNEDASRNPNCHLSKAKFTRRSHGILMNLRVHETFENLTPNFINRATDSFEKRLEKCLYLNGKSVEQSRP